MTVTESLQSLLAAEHAAVFGYRRLGPHVTDSSGRELARSCEAAHRAVRDELTAALLAAGEVPVRPLADYPLAEPLAGPLAAPQAAVSLEQSCAVAARLLLLSAATPTAAPTATQLKRLRVTAQSELSDSAVRATRWRIRYEPHQATVAFPGIG
ncbi:uncharacterized protein DUF4439 [Jatrophihabitans sp. GAS493]|uniref:DUF4439 domain-containing protein n=1 Tax=Jatrophihabitans sp. GAS493 TaxID=1907575 RepID=UPI000BB81243|nr:DUF4439 domain-containing protein [Jatrophihabitans sp. GAS493]SOD74173.1 uncharacterized protein DUF4439 [Jatrophihabitans sp. GAS493]